MEFSAGQLGGAGFVAPTLIIANSLDGGFNNDGDGGYNLRSPQSPAFDSQGNLWVADSEANVVLKYANVDSLTGIVVIEPSAILSNNVDGGPAPGGGVYFSAPAGIAFDHSGNLWLSSPGETPCFFGLICSTNPPTNRLVMYSNPTALLGKVAPQPAVILTSVSDGGTQAIDSPAGLAFDSQGGLWVANKGYGTVPSFVKLGPERLAASGPVEPTGQIVGTSLSRPMSVAFDQGGNLWAGDNVNALEFPAANVSTLSGVQALDAGWVLFGFVSGVLIDPSPTNLPLAQQH